MRAPSRGVLRVAIVFCGAACATQCRALWGKDATWSFQDFSSEVRDFDFGVASPVTVNQRQLVDKLLARYSAKFGGVLRELIQNADDAAAISLDVALRRDRGAVVGMIVSNDGRPFSDADWARLTRIAEGNPAESTVGMFGVGFYSVFSLTDRPLVQSGGQLLAFQWQKEQLVYARHPSRSMSPNTAFYLEFTEPRVWDIDEMVAVLLQSVLFTRSLRRIRLIADGTVEADIQKAFVGDTSVTHQVLSHVASPAGLLKAQSVAARTLQLRIQRAGAPAPVELPLRLVQAQVQVTASEEFQEQARRTLRKGVPQAGTVHLLYDPLPGAAPDPSADPAESSSALPSSLTRSLLDFVRRSASPEPASSASSPAAPYRAAVSPSLGPGRVFVGMPTSQTTGGHFHLAAPFYPTVERELIDFSTPALALWNEELLGLAGGVARVHYDGELRRLQQRPRGEETQGEALQWLRAHCLQPTAPQPRVGQLLLQAFLQPTGPRRWFGLGGAAPLPFLLPTSQGIALAADTHDVVHPTLNQLVGRRWPVIPTALRKEVLAITEQVVPPLTFAAFKTFLHQFPLTPEEELRPLLDLCASTAPLADCWKEAAVTLPSHPTGLPLRDVHYWLPAAPPNLPLPPAFLPAAVADTVGDRHIRKTLRLRAAPPPTWARWLAAPEQRRCVHGDEPAATATLRYLSALEAKHGSADWYQDAVRALSGQRCVPTDQGMKTPAEAYLPSPLPTAHKSGLPTTPSALLSPADAAPAVSRSLLRALGVRSPPEVGDVAQVVRALGSFDAVLAHFEAVAAQMDAADWEALRKVQFIPTAKGPFRAPQEVLFPAEALSAEGRAQRSPLEPFLQDRVLHLPHLERNSARWDVLAQAGVHEQPTVAEVLPWLGQPDGKRQQAAGRYLGALPDRRFQAEWPGADLKFVPCTDGTVASLSEAFLLDTGGVFRQVAPQFLRLVEQYDLGHRLQLRAAPEPGTLIAALRQRPPATAVAATQLLQYLVARQAEIQRAEWRELAEIPLLPQPDGRCITPSDAVLYSASLFSRYGDLLDYVRNEDPKVQEFLERAGAQPHPSPAKLADSVLRNYRRYWTAPQCDVDQYLAVLREIAVTRANLQKPLLRALAQEPCVPAYTLKDGKPQWGLYPAKDCYLVDNANLHRLLQVPAVPNDPQVQDLCRELGAKWLSQCVEETVSVVGKERPSPQSTQLERAIHERQSLLLTDEWGRRATDARLPSLERLRVLAVPAIRQQVVFEGRRYDFAGAGAPTCTVGSSDGHPTLFIPIGTPYDRWDVATALARLLFKKPSLDKSLRIESLLFSSEDSLRRRGFQIDGARKVPSPPLDPPSPKGPDPAAHLPPPAPAAP
eukprot:EG_transcript_631